MALSDHQGSFVSEAAAFYERYGDIAERLRDTVITQVYGAWDRLEGTWFGEAPMLVETPDGLLSVRVKSETDLALGWNEIDRLKKPRWFGEDQKALIEGLDWVEDLEWRSYDRVRQVWGERFEAVLFHACDRAWGVGLGLKCGSGRYLWLYDAGDVIAARVEPPEEEGRRDGTERRSSL